MTSIPDSYYPWQLLEKGSSLNHKIFRIAPTLNKKLKIIIDLAVELDVLINEELKRLKANTQGGGDNA